MENIKIINGIDEVIVLLLKSKYSDNIDTDFSNFFPNTNEVQTSPTQQSLDNDKPKAEMEDTVGKLGIEIGLSDFSEVLSDYNDDQIYSPLVKQVTKFLYFIFL